MGTLESTNALSEPPNSPGKMEKKRKKKRHHLLHPSPFFKLSTDLSARVLSLFPPGFWPFRGQAGRQAGPSLASTAFCLNNACLKDPDVVPLFCRQIRAQFLFPCASPCPKTNRPYALRGLKWCLSGWPIDHTTPCKLCFALFPQLAGRLKI